MRFTLKNPRSLQYIDYQNVRKTEFLGCQSQEMNGRRLFPVPNVCRNFVGMPNNFLDEYISYLLLTFLRFLRL